MVIGSAASAATLVWFGLSGSFTMALAARCVAGLLNATIVAWKSSIGESCDAMEQGRVSDRITARHSTAQLAGVAAVFSSSARSNSGGLGMSGLAAAADAACVVLAGTVTQVLSYMSLAWGIGCVVGPSLGGLLSDPCTHFPSLPGCAPGGLLQAR
jgi:hypothetical protein